MNIWLIFSIALATVIVALILAYVLKSRLSDDDVWEELVDADAPADSSTESHSYADSQAPASSREHQFSRGEPFTPSVPVQSPRARREVDLRRSTRIEHPVALMILGTNRRGESFQEKTAALSLNLHGCRYSSRHDYPLECWVTLQVTGTEGAISPSIRAKVRSILSAQTPRELCQVGVELETPGNIWGIPAPPEDWHRILGASKASPVMASPVMASSAATAVGSPEEEDSLFETPPVTTERRAEVTVFPGPSTPPLAEASASKEPTVQKTERVVLTPDQLLLALQGKLQQAADRAVQTAIAAHIDESVRTALAKIDDGWKSNLRHTEEFSAARLAEVQNRWEKELVVYRTRADETSRRLEALAGTTQHGLIESQKLAERIKNEVEPELYARVNQTFAKANSEFDAHAAQVSERHLATLAQSALTAAREARSKLDESAAEIRSILGSAPAPGVAEERIAAMINSSREQTISRMEERLGEVSRQFEQQREAARRRADELAQRLENFAMVLREAQAQHVQSFAEIRPILSAANNGISPETLNSHIHAAREQLHNHLEWRLGEFSGHHEQQYDATRQRLEELAQRVASLTNESRDARSQQEHTFAEMRSLASNASAGVSQDRLDRLLNAAREQLLNHFEARVGELATSLDQHSHVASQRSDELAQRLDRFAYDTRAQLEETRKLSERMREPQAEDLASMEQTADRAAKDFETTAARVADRQLIRLTEQKQALAREAALELEARASEARAILEKTANGTLEEFRRRLETQIDLITAEATERVTSTLSSLDKESRAAIDARRRAVENEVAKAAEQSATEFRSGIKAFLYSCLVAAVSAVDQHAQNTLAGLEKDPSAPPPALDAPVSLSKSDGLSSAANASSSSDRRG